MWLLACRFCGHRQASILEMHGGTKEYHCDGCIHCSLGQFQAQVEGWRPRDEDIPPDAKEQPGPAAAGWQRGEAGWVPPEYRAKYESEQSSGGGPQVTEEQPAAAEAEPEPSGIPAFPEIGWRGLFGEWRAAMDGTTAACDTAHFCTFWAASATILGRTVQMYSGDVVYPNVYLTLYGETGDYKTTAERRIYRCNLFEHHPNLHMINNVGSTEGLAGAMAASGTGVCLFFWEEFSTFLAQARWENSTLLQFFTECFDCPPEWARSYTKKAIHVDSPTPSILTATTAEWFWQHAKTGDFYGGFGNRFLFLTGVPKASLARPNIWDEEVVAGIKKRLEVIGSHSPCRAEFTTEARQAWDRFFAEWQEANTKRSSLLRAATKRAHTYVLKLAMTYAALEETLPYIDEDQLLAAIAVVNHAIDCMEGLLDLQAAESRPQGERSRSSKSGSPNTKGSGSGSCSSACGRSAGIRENSTGS
jgi:hypothetical protein